VLKVQPHIDASGNFCVGQYNYGQDLDGTPMTKHFVKNHCPYGQPGDRLWVRETFTDLRGTGIEHRPDPEGPLQRYAYAADCPPGSYADEARKDYGIKWKPSIHMPRAACRILLETTDVRVERLQAISRADIRTEGLQCPAELASDDVSPNYRDWYPAAWRELWESINGPDSWNANPWVWVVEFKRVMPGPGTSISSTASNQ
jgi:hypothetical protein